MERGETAGGSLAIKHLVTGLLRNVPKPAYDMIQHVIMVMRGSMTIVKTPAPVLEGLDSAILERIEDPEVHLVLWRRSLPGDLDRIGSIGFDGIEDLDFTADLDLLDEEVADGLVQAGYPSAVCSGLKNEILAHARQLAGLTNASAVRIRLEIVETDACRKFHTDYVTARLLTTLWGQGTQWIEAAQPTSINQLSAGDVGIFKGRLWAEEPAVLHRSPPLEGTGEARLLLVVDPFDPRETMLS